MDINDLLDKAKEISGSDAKTAKKLGVGAQLVSNWRKGRSSPNLDHIDELSELTGIPFETCAYAVGVTKEKSAGVVGRFTKKFEQIGVALLLVAMTGVNSILSPTHAEAAPILKDKCRAMYIMLSRWLHRAARNQGFAAS